MTFSDLIKEKGYTAATLAEVVGCDKNTIRRYESGTLLFGAPDSVWLTKYPPH